MSNFILDKAFWDVWEDKILDIVTSMNLKIVKTGELDLLDFNILNSKWERIFLEIKSRRNNYKTYPDTIIWMNKLEEALRRYNKWEKTLFVFNFLDWTYFVNPLDVFPVRVEYKKWRYDRWKMDKKKWWCYYDIKSLTKI